ncbi:MAG: glycosyltransferase family 4 protein [Planctomycetes bacterium]|nr:glycosyltransferase family 4 protein [Planctomycetota bacterium]
MTQANGLRILYTSDMLGPHDYRFIERLIERGHDVTLVTYIPDLDRRNFEVSGYDVRQLEGLRVIYGGALGIRPWGAFAKRIVHFRRAVRHVKPDVIHTGYLTTSGLTGALSGFHPLLVMPMGSDVLIDPVKWRFARWAARLVGGRADLFNVNSAFIGRKLVEITCCRPDKVRLIYWGIDMDRFNPGFDREALKKKYGWEGKTVLVNNRTFRPVYGHKYFFEALKRILVEEKDVVAVLGGGGPEEEKLRKLAGDLGIADHLHWPGYVSTDEFVDLLRCGDIYVNSSLSDSSSASLMEAIACGLPCVSTDAGGNVEWVLDGKNGYTVPAANAALLAERTLMLIRDGETRKRMSAESVRIGEERCDRRKQMDKIERLYYELIPQKEPTL